MSKFEIGDRVKAISHEYHGAGIKFGEFGFIYSVPDFENSFYKVVAETPWQRGDNYPWPFSGDQLELAPETKVTEFQAGDTIKVGPTHRNAFGNFLNYPDVVNKEFEVKEVFEHKDYTQVNLKNCMYWVRSDDIELVSRAGEKTEHEIAVDMVIDDLTASNIRLADANEAKADRLEAIKEIVMADEISVSSFPASLLTIPYPYFEGEEKLPKYKKLLEGSSTSNGADFYFEPFEDNSWHEFDVHLIIDRELVWDANGLEHLAEHCNQLAKRIRKKERNAT